MLYLQEGTLIARAFDPEKGQLKGNPPHRVADHIALSKFHNSFDASENGILIYRTSSEADEKRLTWFDRTGKSLGVTGGVGDYFDLRLSPDGRKLVSNAGSPNSEIWVDDLIRAVRTRVTIDPHTDHGEPVWSPDGDRIVFAMGERKTGWGIYQKYSNGAGNEELLLADSQRALWPTSWSADGRFILYSHDQGSQQENIEIWILPLGADRKPRPLVQAPGRAYDGQFSPDGRWVAYTSEESGRGEIYVAPFEENRTLQSGTGPAGAGRWQVSANGGRSPRWRRDSKEVFYLAPTNQMMAAEVERKGSSLVVQPAQSLFRCTPVPSVPSSAPYDVSADGKKFVINSFSDDNSPLVLLVNWTANLK